MSESYHNLDWLAKIILGNHSLTLKLAWKGYLLQNCVMHYFVWVFRFVLSLSVGNGQKYLSELCKENGPFK